MMRILLHFSLALAVAIPAFGGFSGDATAKKRLKSGSGWSYSKPGRLRHRRNNIILQIPLGYFDNRVIDYGFEKKYYRGGPKIINVPETLRKRRKRELLN